MATVLVVDDNPSNLKLTTFLLEWAGHTVLQTGDASRAIQLAHAHRPDIILMDVQLPGIDGLAATRLIKSDERLCHIPVIALTAFAMQGDEERILASGCDAYISKPIHHETLLQTLESVIAGITCT